MRMRGILQVVLVMVFLLLLLAGESLLRAGESKNRKAARDGLGDPLPDGAVARLGSTRLWHSQVTAITFSADSKELATLGVRPDSAGSFVSTVRWWDAANGRLLRELHLANHWLTALAASPDGKQLALGVDGREGRARIALWDVEKGKEIDGPLMNSVWTITFLKYLPDCKTLVSSSYSDSSFRFWDLSTRKEVKVAKPIRSDKKHCSLNASALSNDGTRSAWYVRSYGNKADGDPGRVDGEFIQVIGDGGKLVWQKDGPFHTSIPLALSPDGKLLACTPDRNGPQIIDIASQKTVAVLPLNDEYPQTLFFSPDGKILGCNMMVNNGAIRAKLWDVETRRERCSILVSNHHLQWNAPLSFTADSKSVAIAADGRTRIYDVATGKERVPPPVHHLFPVSKLFFSSDGKTLVSSDKEVVCRWTREANGHPGFRPSPQVRRRADLARLVDNDPPRGDDSVLYTPDLSLALNQEKDVLDLSQSPPRKVCRLQVDQDGSYWGESFSPDNQTVLLVRHERDEPIRMAFEVFETRQGKRIGCWPLSWGWGTTFSPDSRFFAWQERKQGQIVLADLRSVELVNTLTTDLSHKPERPLPPFSTDIVSVPDRGRWAFDCLAVSPDNQRVAAVWNSTLSAQGRQGEWLQLFEEKEPTTLYVWNVARGKEIARIAFKVPKGKMPQVTCLAFLRDGRTLAAGYLNDPRVHLIEIASGRERAVLRGHQGVVRSLALSPDGHHLLSGSDDTTILVWDLDALPSASSRSDKTPLSAKECAQLWEDLAGMDAAVAFRAIEILRRRPEQAITLLRERLQPIPSIKPERIEQWIAELDSGEFAVRERAMKELERLAELAEPALRKALQKPPSLEVRLRLERLLETIAALSLSPERLRQVRGVEVLEAIGDSLAREHLKRLADGVAEARLTYEAAGSLERLSASR